MITKSSRTDGFRALAACEAQRDEARRRVRALEAAAAQAADKLDAALLADPGPLSDYAQARDILRAALAAAINHTGSHA